MKKLLLTLVCLPFLGFGQYLITTDDSTMQFVPDTITCNIGDTVIFQLSSMHNAVEVSESAWIASLATNPIAWGINIPYGATATFVADTARTYYYICQPHANQDMKGLIIVNGPITGCMDTLACNFDSLAVVSDSTLCNYSNIVNVDYSICYGDSLIINGDTLHIGGTYIYNLQNLNGCDSLVYVDLTINSNDTVFLQNSACDSYLWDGISYINSGVYSNSYNNINGCDSIVFLDLIINTSININIDTSICDNTSFQSSGNSYSISGTYTQNLTSIHGCDSTAIINLSVNPTYTMLDTIFETVCDTFNVNGINYDTSGVYNIIFESSLGCDSSVIIDLSVNNSFQDFEIKMVCDTFYWYIDTILIDTITQTGMYFYSNVASNGCDSTYTLDLKVGLSDNLVISQCDQYEWQGIIYDTTGLYIDTLPSSQGCDSIVSLDLTINYSSPSVLYSEQHCESYLWPIDSNVRVNTEYVEIIYTNISGCDSIVALDLQITGNPEVTFSQSQNNTYQWNANVIGGTPPYTYVWDSGISGSSITPTINGTYCVTVVDANNCISQLSCFDVTYFTNSINDIIEAKKLIRVTDVLGREVKDFSRNIPMYFFYKDGSVTQKIIVD